MAQYLTTEVIATIDNITNPGETFIIAGVLYKDSVAAQSTHVVLVPILQLTAYISLGMSEDVSITRSGKGIEHTPLTQIDDGVADYRSEETATIDELSLSHVLIMVCLLRHTGGNTHQVDVTTVFRIVFEQFTVKGVCTVRRVECAIGSRRVTYWLTDDAFLATTEDLEGIASLQVDGGTAPNLGILTMPASKHVQCLSEHVHTLLVEDNAGTSLGDYVVVGFVQDGLTLGIALDAVEHAKVFIIRRVIVFTIHDSTIDVDDHIAIDNTAVVAAAVDISTE